MTIPRSVQILVVMVIMLSSGESAPRRGDPLKWNFLLKKEPIPTLPAPRWDKEDSLRIPPVDFLLKKPSHAQNKHSTRFRDDSEQDDSNYDEFNPDFKRPLKKRPSKPQNWGGTLKSTLSTSKRAIANYVKAVKKMFKSSSGDEEEQERHSLVQERGDHKTGPSNSRPLRTKKYGTNLELDSGNRVKSVAMVLESGGDPFTETSYLKGGGIEDEEYTNLGIGEAISDLFWGSVYGGQK